LKINTAGILKNHRKERNLLKSKKMDCIILFLEINYKVFITIHVHCFSVLATMSTTAPTTESLEKLLARFAEVNARFAIKLTYFSSLDISFIFFSSKR
jgi:hypothetical protein